MSVSEGQRQLTGTGKKKTTQKTNHRVLEWQGNLNMPYALGYIS